MKTLAIGILCAGLAATALFGQTGLNITATPLPMSLLTQNYGRMPRNIGAYDLTICNSSSAKMTVVSSDIFQALVQQQAGVQPIGKQMMLAAILRNQNNSFLSILNLALGSASGVLSVLSSAHTIPSNVITGTSLGSLALQQVLNTLRPYSSPSALQQLENQVLETAISLDSGSCVERTVFTLIANKKVKQLPLSFHVR
jgi:Mrp family chromosome partitioning ATPase